jgi:hypothetical protein
LPRCNSEIIIERSGSVKTATPEMIMPPGQSNRTPRRSRFIIALSLLAALQAVPGVTGIRAMCFPVLPQEEPDPKD